MTNDNLNIVFLALCLVLPISALAARRLPLSSMAKMALAWVAIFGAAFALVELWQMVTGAGTIFGRYFL